MTKQGERRAVSSAEKHRLKPYLMCWKMGEEAQRDRGLEQCTNINMQQRERPSEPGQSWWVHTTELRQHGRSGILTLAFSANCYSFTPALFPKTLNLQSLCVRCGYYISQHALGRLGASHEYRPQLLTLTYFVSTVANMRLFEGRFGLVQTDLRKYVVLQKRSCYSLSYPWEIVIL